MSGDPSCLESDWKAPGHVCESSHLIGWDMQGD